MWASNLDGLNNGRNCVITHTKNNEHGKPYDKHMSAIELQMLFKRS
jgi:hypothetical protein